MGKTKTAFVGETSQQGKPKTEKKKEPQKVHLSGLKGGQRVKSIEAEAVVPIEETTGKKTKKKTVKVRSKKYQEAKGKVDRNKEYKITDAIKLVKETSYSKFDGTMEAHLTVKKAGIFSPVNLPFSGGRTKKIEVADEETIKKLKAGKVDFDVLLATPDMMPKLVVFAKVLGPRGLMPNPKNGTLIKSKEDAKKFSANTFTLKTEKEAPLIHVSFGKVSQKEDELTKNFEAIADAVGKKQIVKAYIKATMSPSVRVAIS